jgi:hypothetical protein
MAKAKKSPKRKKSRKSRSRTRSAATPSEPEYYETGVTLLLREHDFSLAVHYDGSGEPSTDVYNFDFGAQRDPTVEAEDVAQLIMERYGRAKHLNRQTESDVIADVAVEAVSAAMLFANNASFEEFVEVYGDDAKETSESRNGYLMSKLVIMRADLGRFISELDGPNRRRFVRLALERYRRTE